MDEKGISTGIWATGGIEGRNLVDQHLEASWIFWKGEETKLHKASKSHVANPIGANINDDDFRRSVRSRCSLHALETMKSQRSRLNSGVLGPSLNLSVGTSLALNLIPCFVSLLLLSNVI